MSEDKKKEFNLKNVAISKIKIGSNKVSNSINNLKKSFKKITSSKEK